MATTYTPNAKLPKPAFGDRSWHVPILAGLDTLEALAPVSGLNVSTTEVPSASLNVRVASGSFTKPDGTLGSYAGSPSTAVASSSTRYIWLDNAGSLQSGASFPATTYIPLAIVTTSGSTVTSIADARRPAGHVLFTGLVSAANDSAASAAGVPVGGLYQASGAVRVRLT